MNIDHRLVQFGIHFLRRPRQALGVLTHFQTGHTHATGIDSLKSLVGGKVSVNDMSGPVGIVNMIGDSYEQSVTYGYYMVFLQMLYIAIFLSANLGVMNLLPLPALDGGRLLFLIVEVIRGKRVDPDKEGMVHFIGMMLLFALMFFTFFNDIRKLFG